MKFDAELEGADLREVCRRYKAVLAAAGVEVPADPYEQLRAAVCAVFGSWNTPRAVKYRSINRIHGLKGTAVNVQVGSQLPSSRSRSRVFRQPDLLALLPSMPPPCSAWCTATSTPTAGRVSSSRATPPPAPPGSTGSTCRTRRARTSWRVRRAGGRRLLDHLALADWDCTF